MAVKELSKDNFDEAIKSGTVLVDFWASWCGPCRMVSPIIDKLSEEYKDSVKVYKVNVDEEGELALRYGIMSIPTVIAFKNGAESGKLIGVSSMQEYADLIK